MRNFGLASLFCLLASTSAFAYGGYVAISFNPSTGVYGTSYGDSSYTESEAINRAVVNCDEAGGACGSSVTSNYDGWVALVRGDRGHWHMAPGISESDAENSALAQCENATGHDGSCQVIRSLSSYSYGPDDYGFKR